MAELKPTKRGYILFFESEYNPESNTFSESYTIRDEKLNIVSRFETQKQAIEAWNRRAK